MFKFIKSFFKKEKLSLTLDEIPNWLDYKTKDTSTNLKELLPEKINETKDVINELKNDLVELQEAEIKDEEKIQARVKNIVLSHRKTYIEYLKKLLTNIILPDGNDSKAALNFYRNTQEEITEFSKSTLINI